jgi:radical SAM superfamily enzyme YgiQ (UPF0313 family)
MDILLIHPGEIRHDYITEHLGICSLKAYINSQGYQADTLDMAIESISVTDGLRYVLKINPKIVGVSLLDDSKKKGFALIKTLRQSGYEGIIVVGGYLATFADREILSDFPQIDYVVRGEGEITLHMLMNYLLSDSGPELSEIQSLTFRQDGAVISNQARPLISDLSILPPADRKYAQSILDQGSTLRIYATRGCWGQCSFCDIIGMYASSPGKAWRRRPVTQLVDEIEQLIKTYNTHHFVFNDDQFLVKGKKSYEMVEEFALELERRELSIKFELMCRADTVNRRIMQRLKSVGLQRVFLGLESFDEKQLSRFKKGISVRQNLRAVITLYHERIDVIASVILADAYTTFIDLLKQFIVLYELKIRHFNSVHCQISVNKKLEIYRGSAVYEEYKRNGLLTRDNYLSGYDFKLKFFTQLRIRLFSIEEKLTRLLYFPSAVFKNIRAQVTLTFSNFRKYILGIGI